MYNGLISKNIYRIPFSKSIKPVPEPAPFHYENKWLKNALDFKMPEGTPILAANDGVVITIIEKFTKGSNNKSLANKCNRIIIKHKNGEYTDYVHLKKDGVLVNKGQNVKKGVLIGYSGSTGYITYSHLHFAVIVSDGTGSWKTIMPRFKKNNKIFTLQSPKE